MNDKNGRELKCGDPVKLIKLGGDIDSWTICGWSKGGVDVQGDNSEIDICGIPSDELIKTERAG